MNFEFEVDPLELEVFIIEEERNRSIGTNGTTTNHKNLYYFINISLK